VNPIIAIPQFKMSSPEGACSIPMGVAAVLLQLSS
jgi:hypothetical protein